MVCGSFRFIYNDIEYIFFKSEIDEGHYILYSTDELECVSILIDRKNKLAEIHGIGNYKTCVITTDSNTSVGTVSSTTTAATFVPVANGSTDITYKNSLGCTITNTIINICIHFIYLKRIIYLYI